MAATSGSQRAVCTVLLLMAELYRCPSAVDDVRDGVIEGFNDWGGWGYDDFVPGDDTKTAPSGDETT